MPPRDMDMNLDWRAQNIVKKDGAWTVDGRPNVTVVPAWQENPSNAPDHLYIGLNVTMPVNAASPPHRHGGAAVAATIIKGHVLSQTICDEGGKLSEGESHKTIKIYGPGESWYEPPGCHHVRSENAGDEGALFIASFVIEKKTVEEHGPGVLVQFDADQEDKGNM